MVEEFSKNYITLTIPRDLKNNLNVHGIHKNGNYLKQKGSFSKSSTLKPEQTEKMLEALYQANKKVEAGEIKTEKELKNYFKEKHSDIKIEPNSSSETFTVYFSALIEKIDVTLRKTAPKTEQKTMYNTHENYQEKLTRQPFLICEDLKSEKFGIIDLKGDWVVLPQFVKISQHNFIPNHFQAAATEKDNLNEHWYRLDAIEKKLIKVTYEPDVWSKKNRKNMLIVGNPINKKEGMLRATDGKIMIPYEYEDLGFREDDFIDAELKDENSRKKGIITDENKIVIPIEFKYVKDVGRFLVGYSHDLEAEKIYDRTGKFITQDYFLSADQFSDGLLKVVTKKVVTKEECEISDSCLYSTANGKKKYYLFQQYHFIDETGERKISLDPTKFNDVGDFHNGRAWIKNEEGLYGYIDMSGKIVIEPQFEYTVGMDFYGKYAVVEIGDEEWFIDQAGKKIKKLPDSSKQGGKDWIMLYDGSKYNYDGELIKQ